MCGGSGGSGSGGRSGGGGGDMSKKGDAGQPGEVVRQANRAKELRLANDAIKAKPKDLKKWSDSKLSSAIDAIRANQHLDANNRAEDRIIRERLRRF